MKRLGFLFGIAFGGIIAAGRMNEYSVIHDALRITNLYVFFVMGSAIAVAMPVLYILRKRNWTTPLGGPFNPNPSRIERKHVYGGIIFGTGWALAGTCPAPALAMVGAGGVLGLVVVAGIFSGLLLRDSVTEATSISEGEKTGATMSNFGRPGPATTPSIADL